MPRFAIGSLLAATTLSSGLAQASQLRRLGGVGFDQVGNSLLGVPTMNSTFVDTDFGSAVVLSADGSRMVIGTPNHDYDSADDSGIVNEGGGGIYVYDFVGEDWSLQSFFYGDPGEHIGSRLALSDDGSTLAIRRNSTGEAYIEIYDIGGASANQVGSPLICDKRNAEQGNGDSVALSADGSRVAMSCEAYFNNRGKVQTYELDGGDWVALGELTADDPNGFFGWAVTFDASGDRLAVSAYGHNLDGPTRRGLVQVFDYNGTAWDQVGNNLEGTEDREEFGHGMALSADGSTLAIGSPRRDGTGSLVGALAMYEFDGSIWTQKGSTLDGLENSDRFGWSVAVSDDGGRVAASAPFHNGGRGQIKLLEYDGSEWVQVNGEIEGESNLDRFGFGIQSVTLNGLGDRLASASLWYEETDDVSVGQVRVFDQDVVPSTAPSDIPSSTPTSSSSSPSLAAVAEPSAEPSLVLDSTTSPIGATSAAPSSAPVVTTTAPSSTPSTITTNGPTITDSPSSSTGTALPTITLGKFEWDVDPIGDATIHFDDASDKEEIKFSYNISLRDFTATVYDYDCTTPVPLAVVGVAADEVVNSPSHGTLNVALDIKQDTVVGSGIWEDGDTGEGFVKLCLRVDLVLSETDISVNFHETKMNITIGLNQGFSVTNIDLEREAADETDEEANLDYGVGACQCNEFAECATEVLVQGDDVYICVFTNATDIKLVGIETLDFIQNEGDDDEFSVRPIENSLPNALTAIDLRDGKRISIRSQMLSAFFVNDNPGDVVATGVATLAFEGESGRRQLHTINLEKRMSRQLDEEDGGFSVMMELTNGSTEGSGASHRVIASMLAGLGVAVATLAF